MKKVFLFIVIASLLVSCLADPEARGAGNHISLTNYTEKTIWYQVKKTADPDSGIYKSVGSKGYAFVPTETSEAYTVLFSTIVEKHEEIKDGKLVTVTTMTDPAEITIVTSVDRNNITFSQTETGIVWIIEH